MALSRWATTSDLSVAIQAGPMSESRTIVVTIIGTGVALGALLIGLVMNQNLRIDDLRGDLTGQIDDVKTDIRDISSTPAR